MDWGPIREAVREACATATGLAIEDVLLETERAAFAGKSRGRRLRLDWEESDESATDLIYQEQPDGELVEVAITDEVIIVNARFYCDDHRVRSDSGGWAFELAHSLKKRLYLTDVAKIYNAVGLVLAATDVILPDPRVEIDGRDMSVATLPIRFNFRSCEFENEPPGDPDSRTEYFDRSEIDQKRPRAAYQRDLLDLGPWRFLWLGEETDVAGGRIVLVSGDSVLRVGDPRHWEVNTGALALEDLDQGQLLESGTGTEGQAIAIVLRAPQPAATISIVGRVSSGFSSRGWALEGLSDGALRLSAIGSSGTTTAQLAALLDGTWRVVVVHNAAGVLTLYEGGNSASASISGSHLADGPALTTGALQTTTAGVDVRLLGQVVTDDPDGFRAALAAELGL